MGIAQIQVGTARRVLRAAADELSDEQLRHKAIKKAFEDNDIEGIDVIDVSKPPTAPSGVPRGRMI